MPDIYLRIGPADFSVCHLRNISKTRLRRQKENQLHLWNHIDQMRFLWENTFSHESVTHISESLIMSHSISISGVIGSTSGFEKRVLGRICVLTQSHIKFIINGPFEKLGYRVVTYQWPFNSDSTNQIA